MLTKKITSPAALTGHLSELRTARLSARSSPHSTPSLGSLSRDRKYPDADSRASAFGPSGWERRYPNSATSCAKHRSEAFPGAPERGVTAVDASAPRRKRTACGVGRVVGTRLAASSQRPEQGCSPE